MPKPTILYCTVYCTKYMHSQYGSTGGPASLSRAPDFPMSHVGILGRATSSSNLCARAYAPSISLYYIEVRSDHLKRLALSVP
jgi:hypothetical protein